ncbi:MAG: hypothetical protein H7177_08920 [Rhizobacter sp.]|nr:hypothetical protein [Bacteriovorax sp.]
MEKKLIFLHPLEDFAKIFLATFLVFACLLTTDIMTSATFIFITVYFLDGGHVYSTLLEVVGDPVEVKKKYVWIVLLGSFFLNLVIHFFFKNYFFYYIFYFTIYHNMRQGLGVTFLYRLGEKRSAMFIKWSYYLLTIVPFILFHLRPPLNAGKLSEQILKPVDFYNFFSAHSMEIAFKTGIFFYITAIVFIACWLIYHKNFRGFLAMSFFTAVYAYSFLISNNEMKSYALLIFSHAVPYYFLMEKRINVTHKLNFVQKYGWIILLAIFAIGGLIDSYQEDIVFYFEPFDSLAVALLTTPLISHFIFDAILWKRGNERFQVFVTAAA